MKIPYSSERAFNRFPSGHRTASIVGLLAVVLTLRAGPAASGGLITREQALISAFPGATIKAERIFLTEAEMKEAGELAGNPIASALIARYTAFNDGREAGRAYVDTHIIRTKKESLLIILDAEGALKRIEVTAFLEPQEYMAPGNWYAQYQDKRLTRELHIQREIRPLAGATLTAAATNQAARRVLAIDRVLLRRKTGASGK